MMGNSKCYKMSLFKEITGQFTYNKNKLFSFRDRKCMMVNTIPNFKRQWHEHLCGRAHLKNAFRRNTKSYTN